MRTVLPPRLRKAGRHVMTNASVDAHGLVAEDQRLNHLISDLYAKLDRLSSHVPVLLSSISVQNDAARRAARLEAEVTSLTARVNDLSHELAELRQIAAQAGALGTEQ